MSLGGVFCVSTCDVAVSGFVVTCGGFHLVVEMLCPDDKGSMVSTVDKLSTWIYGCWFLPSPTVTCGKCRY